MDAGKLDDFYRGTERPENLEELVEWFRDATNRHTHGLIDNDIWSSEGLLVVDNSDLRIKKIREGYGKLVCHCRYISKTMVSLLNNVGIDTRLVEFVSGSCHLTDSRHTCFEVRFDGKYVHGDVNMGVLFRKDDGAYMSSLEIKRAFDESRINKSIIERIGEAKKFHSGTSALAIDAANDTDKLINWYARMMNAILIGTDIYTCDMSLENVGGIKADMIASKKGKETFLSLAVFKEKYYGSFFRRG